MIDFDERDVPADVRARITGTVHRGLAEPDRRNLRTPLAVAASVAVLLVAGLVTVLTVHNRAEQVPASPWTNTKPAPNPAAEEIDRCWAAVVAAGKQEDFPARSTWAAVQRQPSTSANVTALRGEGKTFFCMTTKATVTVTDPDAELTPVPGTSYAVALADDTGWVVGTAPSGAQVFVERNGAEFGVPPTNGVFLIHVAAEHDLASRVRMDDKQIPAVPAPAVESTDRPMPPPDRTSKAGRQLGDCIDKAGWPKWYADQWQPGGYAESGAQYLVVGISEGQLGRCAHTSAGDYDFIPIDPLPASPTPRYLTDEESWFLAPDGLHRFVVGSVPDHAKTMIVRTADGVAHPATVSGGVWVVLLPAVNSNGSGGDPDPATIESVTVQDAAAKVVYDGPPALIKIGK